MDAEIPTSSPRSTLIHSPLREILAGLALLAAAALAAPQARAAEDDGEDASMTPATTVSGASYSSTLTGDGQYRVTARFSDFRGDPLTIGFLLPPSASRASLREFGVSDAELERLLQACLKTRGCDQREFDRHTTRYYREHALALDYAAGPSPRLYVDVAQVVRRNRERVRPVAAALRRLAAERGHDRQWTIEAAVALVQTGLVYRKPASREDGRQILGFYPPPRALERGYGDCDTKAALLAAILQNLTDTPIIGVHVPRHYLLGLAGTPAAGQAAMHYQGRPYVLVETAGPGKRPPGDIAQSTQLALDARSGLRVDPMF